MAIALDVHAHLLPAGDLPAGIEGVAWQDGKLVIDGHAVGMRALFDPAQLLGWMAENGVAHAYVSAPPPAYRPHLGPEQTRIWVDFLNAGLAQIAAQHPDRLTPLVHLPTHAPDVAAGIAEAATAAGGRHFSMPTGAGEDILLSDTAFRPLWQALNEAGAFVFLHPGECGDGRLRPFYLGNLVGNPQETAVAVAHLVFGGVIEDFAAIRFCLAHGGGTVPMLAGRWQQGYDTARPGVDTTRMAPKDLIARLHVDCICHSPAAITHAAEVFGKDRVVFGSDWPFPMGLMHPEAALADVPEQLRRRITWDNPTKILEEGN